MKILVTGGAGFIGSHISEYFLSEGHEVVILDNLETGYMGNLPSNATFIEGDICEPDILKKAMQGVDFVFHQAAMVSVPISCQRPHDAFKINTLGTLNVLQQAAEAGVEKVIMASSAAVYGNNPILPKKEDMLPEPASPYAITKLDCEHLAKMFYNDHGLRTTCLRYFNVYGPRQDPTSPYAAAISIFMERASKGQDITIYGDGKQTRDFVYVKDVVRANVAAMDNGDGDVFNVATGKSVTIQEIAETIINITDSSSKIVHAEERTGDVRDSLADVSKISPWWKSEVELAYGLGKI